MVFNRDIRSRVEQATPFLSFDSDPYPVIVDGRIVWMLDGYTTSSSYPYSQPFSGEGALGGTFNYVRNPVKATVDAYTGRIHYYVIDPKDPIIQAWGKAFPDLLEPISAMPAALRSHLRYPQDLFKAQTDVYRTYHMTNPTTFYNKTDTWAVSPDPGQATRTWSLDATWSSSSRTRWMLPESLATDSTAKWQATAASDSGRLEMSTRGFDIRLASISRAERVPWAVAVRSPRLSACRRISDGSAKATQPLGPR